MLCRTTHYVKSITRFTLQEQNPIRLDISESSAPLIQRVKKRPILYSLSLSLYTCINRTDPTLRTPPNQKNMQTHT